MKHYIDITLLPSDDIGIHFLWSKVMMQVHLALVEIQDELKKVPVAVSFPEYRDATTNSTGFIGNKLRLFSHNYEDFERLNIDRWLNRLQDYIHVKAVKDVPDGVADFEKFTRRQKAGSPDRLIRRRMKRKDESLEQAQAHFAQYELQDEDKKLPFVKLKSLTSDHSFHLVIQRKQLEDINANSSFSTYGLSSEGCLPKF